MIKHTESPSSGEVKGERTGVQSQSLLSIDLNTNLIYMTVFQTHNKYENHVAHQLSVKMIGLVHIYSAKQKRR